MSVSFSILCTAAFAFWVFTVYHVSVMSELRIDGHHHKDHSSSVPSQFQTY